MLSIEKKYDRNDIELTADEQMQRIAAMEHAIVECREDGERLLSDAHYQALKLIEYVRDFYTNNQDLILTFMQGKQVFPSFILQKMVWTIGNEESYPGVLYSYHSRTGCGRHSRRIREGTGGGGRSGPCCCGRGPRRCGYGRSGCG